MVIYSRGGGSTCDITSEWQEPLLIIVSELKTT